jgi:putative membrane protein
MNRRHLLSVGALAAAAPVLFRPALAQTVTDDSVTSQMGAGAAGEGAPLVTDPALLADIDPAKRPMITLANYSRQASQLAIGSVQSQALREFAALEIAEQDAVLAAFGFVDGPVIMTRQQADMLATMSAGLTDLAFLSAQIDAHREALAAAQGYASTGDDPMACGAAIVAVPAIESHIVMLQMIREAEAL